MAGPTSLFSWFSVVLRLWGDVANLSWFVFEQITLRVDSDVDEGRRIMNSVHGMVEGLDRTKRWFRNEKGAVDLASIMVGILVIGLIGGVIAATVFVIIPWAQDRAAKQQVGSIVAAQSAYRGLSSGVPPAVPENLPENSYADSADLSEAQLLREGATYCTVRTSDGEGYLAVALSGSGKFFAATDVNTKPYEIEAEDITSGCDFPEVDMTPNLTVLTYKCPTDQYVYVPVIDGTGTATWSDGDTDTYDGSSFIIKNLKAGVEYQFTFDGTYTRFGRSNNTGAECLVSMNHWGLDTGVKDASYAFHGASNLVDVPKRVPSSITNMEAIFSGNYVLNDPDISHWDVSSVTNMKEAFSRAYLFNQPLNDWDVSNVTDMESMFGVSWREMSFNQPLDKWDVSKVTNMKDMFRGCVNFNQPLNSWNVSRVKDMSRLFYGTSFNQPLDKWNVSSVEDMSFLFGVTPFNESLDMWNVSKVERMSGMFYFAREFNKPLNGWGDKVSNVTDMSDMFNVAEMFNQPLNMWDVSNVENMKSMFSSNNAFNQNINDWNVSKVKNMSGMFNVAQRFNQPLDQWDVSNVENMSNMFETAGGFKQELNMWDVSSVTDMSYMFSNNYGFNQPLNNWNVSKVENMDSMFDNNTFQQDVSGWKTVSLKSGATFAPDSFPTAFMPPGTSR